MPDQTPDPLETGLRSLATSAAQSVHGQQGRIDNHGFTSENPSEDVGHILALEDLRPAHCQNLISCSRCFH